MGGGCVSQPPSAPCPMRSRKEEHGGGRQTLPACLTVSELGCCRSALGTGSSFLGGCPRTSLGGLSCVGAGLRPSFFVSGGRAP